MVDLEKIQDFNYEGQRLLFKNSKRLDYDRFTILFLEEFDDDYLNLAINIKSKNEQEFQKDFVKIKEIMNQNKRKASVFINNDILLKTVDFNKNGLEISDDSVWLMIDNLKNFPKYESEIPIKISKINKNEERGYPDFVKSGFTKSSQQDPYDGLSESIVEAIRRSIYINDKFITEHYVAKYNEQIVGTTTIMYEKEIAYIYNVTTNVNYRKKGICKKMMTHIIRKIIGIRNKRSNFTNRIRFLSRRNI